MICSSVKGRRGIGSSTFDDGTTVSDHCDFGTAGDAEGISYMIAMAAVMVKVAGQSVAAGQTMWRWVLCGGGGCTVPYGTYRASHEAVGHIKLRLSCRTSRATVPLRYRTLAYNYCRRYLYHYDR